MDVVPFLGLREPVSSLTHLATAMFAAYMTLLFVRLTAGDQIKQRSMIVYGLSMVVLYTASGVYHAVPGKFLDPTVTFFRRIDVSAIFVLIAGSFTPIISVLLSGSQRARMLIVMWALATIAIAVKWLVPGIPHPVTVCMFIAAGLPGFLPLGDYRRALASRGVAWILGGSACFLLGGVLDVLEWPAPVPGLINAHELTHLLDMAGTAAHVVFMVRFIIPFQPAVDLEPVPTFADVA
jgi:hemolysin III